MKPFILQFKESPIEENLDYSLIEYDSELNLNVVKSTRQPAVEFYNLDTTTFTRTNSEGADSDNDRFAMLLDTKTMTFVNNEDSDDDRGNRQVRMLLDTVTGTKTTETGDSDK